MEPHYRIMLATESPLVCTSSGYATSEIAKRLVKKGHHVTVLAWEQNSAPIHHLDGYRILSGGTAFGAYPVNGRDGITVMDREVLIERPDVIYTDAPLWSMGQCVKTSNALRIPLVAHMGHRGFPMHHKYVNMLSMVHTPLWKSEFARDQFASLVERYISDGTGVMSDEKTPFMDRYVGNLGDTVPMGADSELFKPMKLDDKTDARAKLGITDWRLVFLSVGRNTSTRQYPRLFEAFKMYISRGGIGGLIVHCGDPTGINTGGWDLITLAQSMGISDRVMFSDQSNNPKEGLDPSMLAHLYNISDCFITATSGTANGNSIAEAMMAGLPVIMPDHSMAMQHIRKNTGTIVPTDTSVMQQDEQYYGLVNEHALSEALSDYESLSDKERKKMAREARKYAEKVFDWDKVTDDLIDALGMAINTPHPHGNNTEVHGE